MSAHFAQTATTMTAACPAPKASPYWKSVKLCRARPDGSAEIHRHDGRVEHIAADGRVLRPSRSRQSSETAFVTPTQRKEETRSD